MRVGVYKIYTVVIQLRREILKLIGMKITRAAAVIFSERKPYT